MDVHVLIKIFFKSLISSKDSINKILEKFSSDEYNYSLIFKDNITENVYGKIINYLNSLKLKNKYIDTDDYIDNNNKNIKYKKIKDFEKIEKIKIIENIESLDILLEKSAKKINIVKELPSDLIKTKKSYYIINDYVEVVISNDNNNYLIKINIKNKSSFKIISNFYNLFTHVFIIYCIIKNTSNIVSNNMVYYLLNEYKKIFDDKDSDLYLTFKDILSGTLINYNDNIEYNDYNIVETDDCILNKNNKNYFSINYFENESLIYYVENLNLLYIINIITNDVDVISLDNNNIWIISDLELQIIDFFNNYNKSAFLGFVNYKSNTVMIYDLLIFNNEKLFNKSFIERYNLINNFIQNINITGVWSIKIHDIDQYQKYNYIYKNFQYMIKQNAIGIKYISNDSYFDSKYYKWISYNKCEMIFLIINGIPYINYNDSNYEMSNFIKLINTNDNINGIYLCLFLNEKDNENKKIFKIIRELNNKSLKSFKLSNTNIEYNNFKMYFDFVYNPIEIIKNNKFDILTCLSYKLKYEFNSKIVKNTKFVLDNKIPIFLDPDLLIQYIDSNLNKNLKVGLIYIDKWILDYYKSKNIDLSNSLFNFCKLINIDNLINNKLLLKININFDNYLKFSYINDLFDILGLIIFDITDKKDSVFKMTTVKEKISLEDVKKFIKNNKSSIKPSKPIQQYSKKDELIGLIHSSGYTMDDVKKYIELDKTKENLSEKVQCDQNDSVNNYYSYMYNDIEMEYYRKYVRQCTNQLKQTAYKRGLINDVETEIDRKNLICLLVKRQCKNESKPKITNKKTKAKITSIYNDETYKILGDEYKTDEKPYICKGYKIVIINNLLLLKTDNYDVSEFLFLVNDGFSNIGNIEKDIIIRSFKQNVKICLDNNIILNINNNKIIQITNEIKSFLLNKIFNTDIEINEIYTNSFSDNYNIINLMIIYSLFLSIGIDIYEYNKNSNNVKLLFSSDIIIQSNLFPNINKDIVKYNILIINNESNLKHDFYFHIKKSGDDILFISDKY